MAKSRNKSSKRDRGRPIAIDLFSGVGGLSLGLEQAGFKVACSVEIDPVLSSSYEDNFPDAKILRKDIRNLVGKEVLDYADLKPGSVDLVAGGPPCQGFSSIGRRQTDDPRNSLILEFSRLVSEIKPRYFVLENVAGLLFNSNSAILEKFQDSFAEYELLSPLRIDASKYGVPQRRRRVFIFGYRSDCQPPEPPVATAVSVSVRDAIEDLEVIETVDGNFDEDEYFGSLPDPSNEYARLMRACDPSRKQHAGEEIRNRLTGCARTRHSEAVTQRFEALSPGQRDAASRLPRLDYGSYAPTIRAGTGPENGSYTSARPVHPRFARCITVREAARLHSFPDWFQFHPTKWHGYRQVGNSVPPLLAKAMGLQIIEAINVGRNKGEIVNG